MSERLTSTLHIQGGLVILLALTSSQKRKNHVQADRLLVPGSLAVSAQDNVSSHNFNYAPHSHLNCQRETLFPLDCNFSPGYVVIVERSE